LANVAATDAEKAEARKVAERIKFQLDANDWPEPIEVDSGNGFYLYYRVDLPRDEGGICEKILKKQSSAFSNELAEVDEKNLITSRIMRVPGPLNRKGEDPPDRPLRRAKIIYKPAVVQPVPRKLLEELAEVGEPQAQGKYDHI